jgi:sigma-B regulation protein RsbU (phosphoserine phosphatase)
MRLSVGTQLAVVTVSVLFSVTALLVSGLASRERQRAIESKAAAATMVTELFSASVSAGVVFGDDEAIRSTLDNLSRTEDVVGAVVFQAPGAPPLGRFGESLALTTPPGVEVTDTRLVVTKSILDHEGKHVAEARVAFSLERDNAAVARTSRDLIVFGGGVMLVTALLLIGLARSRVVRPLDGLVEVARQIEKGKATERAIEHGAPEIATLARAFNNMTDALAERELRLRKELEVAADLQLSILPKGTRVGGAEVAAVMKPTTEVGGDYYDVIPTEDGAWIAIGDVSGHGLGAGVIMLMIQSAIATLTRGKPDVTPAELESAVNRVIYDNVRERMGRDDFATLAIFRYWNDGRVRFAGAHEEGLVFRARSGVLETFETPGTWVGAREDISAVTVESTLSLAAGDVLVLHTDGVTEAKRGGVQFGAERLASVVEAAVGGTAIEVRDAIVKAVFDWTPEPKDDVSVVVLRQRGADRS